MDLRPDVVFQVDRIVVECKPHTYMAKNTGQRETSKTRHMLTLNLLD